MKIYRTVNPVAYENTYYQQGRNTDQAERSQQLCIPRPPGLATQLGAIHHYHPRADLFYSVPV